MSVPAKLMNFYNEFDEFKCEWIQNLVSAHQISDGKIDGRSITEVEAAELVGYDQCHFFCGIAGWSKALQIAGYGGTSGIWTGSPPCQPFSVAGKRKGEKDTRHLWPEFRRLIAQRKPAICFIEQVASKDGREWFSRVRADFEDMGYRVGAADLCGASCGAPHIRQRLYIGAVRMADTSMSKCNWRSESGREHGGTLYTADGSRTHRVADPQHNAGRSADVSESRRRGPAETDASECGRSGGMANASHKDGRSGKCREEAGTRENSERRIGSGVSRIADRMGDTVIQGLEGHPRHESRGDEPGRNNKGPARSAPAAGSWSDFRVIDCLDGKKRRVGTGIQPLAHGIPRGLGQSQSELRSMVRPASSNRKGRLKGYGDAIIPELAALFVTEFFKAIYQ